VNPTDYVEFLDSEYLRRYVADGGAAVKFVVPANDEDADAFDAALVAEATAKGYLSLRVDAVNTRLHLMDQVFFAIARQIDWRALSRSAVRDAVTSAGYPPADVPTGDGGAAVDPLTVEHLAAHHAVDVNELTRDLNRELQQRIRHDYEMSLEFRVAMLRLCQAELASGQVTEVERDAVIAWLTGELRQMSMLRSAMIFRRIGRHNARPLLFSLAHWLALTGYSGLVLQLDMRRLGFARRPLPEERRGIYYTKAALLDAYELLRQLVDNTDELSRCAIVVVAAPEFITDETRGMSAYQALQLRIHHEVRDRTRDNPYASLIRLGSS
jgi:hypothetical protein